MGSGWMDRCQEWVKPLSQNRNLTSPSDQWSQSEDLFRPGANGWIIWWFHFGTSRNSPTTNSFWVKDHILYFHANKYKIWQNIINKCLCIFFITFKMYQAGQIEPPSGPVLVRRPYVWHPWSIVYVGNKERENGIGKSLVVCAKFALNQISKACWCLTVWAGEHTPQQYPRETRERRSPFMHSYLLICLTRPTADGVMWWKSNNALPKYPLVAYLPPRSPWYKESNVVQLDVKLWVKWNLWKQPGSLCL